ncbi:MAG: N-acetyltransferase [Ardenticatenaceae bacterium]|nr:N-acetyltransferase [Ardenticatenaceae bacterium]
MAPEDWPQVQTIYKEGLDTGNATFETQTPEWEAWDKKHLTHSRLVARQGDVVMGWAALTPVSARAVYAGVAEVSIYIGAVHRGQGIGHALMAALITEAEAHGIWTLQASIFPENVASVQLHLRHGFRQLGRRERIAQLHGVWRDTVILERRSQVVGL